MWDGWMGVRPNVRGIKEMSQATVVLGWLIMKEIVTPQFLTTIIHYKNCNLHSIYRCTQYHPLLGWLLAW